MDEPAGAVSGAPTTARRVLGFVGSAAAGGAVGLGFSFFALFGAAILIGSPRVALLVAAVLTAVMAGAMWRVHSRTDGIFTALGGAVSLSFWSQVLTGLAGL